MRRTSRHLSFGLSLVAVLAATTACQPFGDLRLPAWPDNPNWQSLVPGPASDDVKPVSVVRTHGNVTNAGALTGSGGSTVLTVAPGGPSAIVVLDYGREVGGTPYLGVADSSGSFPVPYKRFDPVTGNFADPGRVAGDALVFANLRPGRYRLALVFLHESRIATKLLPKHKEKFEDRCMVYSDSLPDLTFTIADGEVRYVGRVIRRVLPTLNQEDLWKTRVEWTPGDEQRALKSLGKRKDMAPWRELLLARLAMLDSSAARVR